MALIEKLNKIDRNSSVQNPVEAAYNIVEKDGERYLQINTYGSSVRKAKGEVSQTIQFNRESAKQLTEIIKTELNIE